MCSTGGVSTIKLAKISKILAVLGFAICYGAKIGGGVFSFRARLSRYKIKTPEGVGICKFGHGGSINDLFEDPGHTGEILFGQSNPKITHF